MNTFYVLQSSFSHSCPVQDCSFFGIDSLLLMFQKRRGSSSCLPYLLLLLSRSFSLRFSLHAVGWGEIVVCNRKHHTKGTKVNKKAPESCARTEFASASSFNLQESARDLAFLCISSTRSLLVSGLDREISAW